jgi:disulfide bond formation protein DsbB
MFKNFYLLICLLCCSLMGFALVIQHHGWQGVLYPPCPLCILQRVAFLGVAIASFFAYLLSRFRIPFHFLGLLAALCGLAIALRHQWVIYHPEAACGLDPLEVFINQFEIVGALPFFFKADGFCSMPLPPILYLSVPEWSLLFFCALTLMLTIGLFYKSRKSTDGF